MKKLTMLLIVAILVAATVTPAFAEDQPPTTHGKPTWAGQGHGKVDGTSQGNGKGNQTVDGSPQDKPGNHNGQVNGSDEKPGKGPKNPNAKSHKEDGAKNFVLFGTIVSTTDADTTEDTTDVGEEITVTVVSGNNIAQGYVGETITIQIPDDARIWHQGSEKEGTATLDPDSQPQPGLDGGCECLGSRLVDALSACPGNGYHNRHPDQRHNHRGYRHLDRAADQDFDRAANTGRGAARTACSVNARVDYIRSRGRSSTHGGQPFNRLALAFSVILIRGWRLPRLRAPAPAGRFFLAGRVSPRTAPARPRRRRSRRDWQLKPPTPRAADLPG